MTNTLASALTGIHGERVALCDVAVSAVLRDLLSEVTVAQTYRNDEQVNIEAVYTFPLPLDAVLLELEVEIAGQTLRGMVVGKKAAEDRYEDAVESGCAAVMLEMIEPGLYTMNLGNLLPGATAIITFSYALLCRWTGDRLRLLLPTTVAPRYGESPHQPHQVPQPSLAVENQFSVRVEICGSLREGQFFCPSHDVKLARAEDNVVISLQQPKAVMDRDFVLNVRAPNATRSFALCGSDGDDTAAIASFQPFFGGLHQPRPLDLAIVIDCSGSMQGDSIAQARQALDGILDALQPHDRVTLIGFGSSIRLLSERTLPCSKTNLARARQFAGQLDANLGGTEIGKALDAAHAALGGSQAADIFLITDGEVASWAGVVEAARRSGHRIFTVGVGSAVSEAFVRGVADGTGGACELVSPREGMSDRIVRHFERMRALRAKRVTIHWPGAPMDSAPSRLDAVFEGDTVIASARFPGAAISGNVVLEVETDAAGVMRCELPLPATGSTAAKDGISTVARLAGDARMKELAGNAAGETAVRYRLASPWTNWLVVADGPDGLRAKDPPALRHVPQTLAAGWGGAGTVMAMSDMACLESPAVMRRSASPVASMAAAGDGAEASFADGPDLPESYRRLLALIGATPSALERNPLDVLRRAGLESEFDDVLRHATDLGLDLDVIAGIILAGLLQGAMDGLLSAAASAAARALAQQAARATDLLRAVSRHGAGLIEVSEDSLGRILVNAGEASSRGTLERFAQCKEFLVHAEAAIRIYVDGLKACGTTRPPRRRGDRLWNWLARAAE